MGVWQEVVLPMSSRCPQWRLDMCVLLFSLHLLSSCGLPAIASHPKPTSFWRGFWYLIPLLGHLQNRSSIVVSHPLFSSLCPPPLLLAFLQVSFPACLSDSQNCSGRKERACIAFTGPPWGGSLSAPTAWRAALCIQVQSFPMYWAAANSSLEEAPTIPLLWKGETRSQGSWDGRNLGWSQSLPSALIEMKGFLPRQDLFICLYTHRLRFILFCCDLAVMISSAPNE